jgi:hypothetical protein
MATFTTAGSKIYIGPVMAEQDADFVVGDFAALSYVAIGNTTNLGDFGDVAAEVTSDEINRQRTRKAKGTRNAGTMTITCNDNPSDAGQAALYAAEQDDADYAFKVVLADVPVSGGAPVGSIRYFVAKVMSTPEGLGGANQFASATFTLGINSNIVRVANSTGDAVPVNSVVPAITGSAVHGAVLSSSTGTWSNTPTAYAYQWKSAGVAVSGETRATYTVRTSDVGNTITVTVTASNSGGSGTGATSSATATVT